MLPPVEDSILRANPKFAALHTTLTTKLLNPSGSTKHYPTQKEGDALKDELKVERIRAAKHQIIRNSVRNLDVSSPTSSSKSSKSHPTQPPLPTELIELILLLSAHLNTPALDAPSQALLQSTTQWASLPAYLPQISTLVSNHIQTQALHLARITSPTTNSSYLHRTIPKIVHILRDLKTKTAQQKIDLAKRRAALVTLTTHVLASYHDAITLTIQHLEQSTHGLLSRHLKSKIEYLSIHAQTVTLNVKEQQTKASKMVYTDRVKEALAGYTQHLRVERERLRERREEARRILWGYGVGRDGGEKERVMREIAKVYAVLLGELEEVKRDVGRLRGK